MGEINDGEASALRRLPAGRHNLKAGWDFFYTRESQSTSFFML